MKQTMSRIVLALLPVVLASLILACPVTAPYALQFLAVSVIGFIAVNRLARKHHKLSWRVDEAGITLNVETCLLGFGLLLMIGSTGGLHSWLLSFYYLYFLFVALVTPVAGAGVALVATVAFCYFFTPEFGNSDYGTLLSLIFYGPVALYFQTIYTKRIREQVDLQVEREKVAYYNLYAEAQQEKLLVAQATNSDVVAVKRGEKSLSSFVRDDLIPQIDELQKLSRFRENQMIISNTLTK